MTSHALNSPLLSQTVTPSRTLSPIERDVLYGRPLTLLKWPTQSCLKPGFIFCRDQEERLMFSPTPTDTSRNQKKGNRTNSNTRFSIPSIFLFVHACLSVFLFLSVSVWLRLKTDLCYTKKYCTAWININEPLSLVWRIIASSQDFAFLNCDHTPFVSWSKWIKGSSGSFALSLPWPISVRTGATSLLRTTSTRTCTKPSAPSATLVLVEGVWVTVFTWNPVTSCLISYTSSTLSQLSSS